MKIKTCPFKVGHRYLAADGHKYKCRRVKELENYWVIVFSSIWIKDTTTYPKDMPYFQEYVDFPNGWGGVTQIYIGEED